MELQSPYPDPRRDADSRAADRVVRALEDRILSGDLAVGAPLPSEREIVEQFQISRTVAREAVNILAGKGLVDARPRYRPVVVQPNADAAFGVVAGVVKHMVSRKGGVKDLFETRTFVEAGLVRQAALHADKDDIVRLRTALAENGETIAESDAFYATDMAFHAVLYTIPRNSVFPAVHKSFATWLGEHWVQMPRLPERNALNFASHQAIFEAILSRDPDAAEAALRSHLSDAWGQVVDTFKDL